MNTLLVSIFYIREHFIADPNILIYKYIRWRHAVAQLVEALRYKSEGRGFDSRWCYWNFSLT